MNCFMDVVIFGVVAGVLILVFRLLFRIGRRVC